MDGASFGFHKEKNSLISVPGAPGPGMNSGKAAEYSGSRWIVNAQKRKL